MIRFRTILRVKHNLEDGEDITGLTSRDLEKYIKEGVIADEKRYKVTPIARIG